LVLIINTTGLNISYFKDVTSIYNISFYVVVLLFFCFTYFYYQKRERLINVLFIFLILISQSYYVSWFYKYILEDQNQNESLSFLEQNAARSLSWVIILPLTLLVLLIIGVVFDLIMNAPQEPKS